MNKRNTVVLAALIIIALTAAGYILLEKLGTVENQENTAKLEAADNVEKPGGTEEIKAVEAVPVQKNEESPKDTVVKSEEIDVVNNTPEYDMKAVLMKKDGGDTFLKLEYYSEGASVEKLLGADVLPQIKDILDSRETEKSNNEAFRLNPVILSPKNQKIYLKIAGKPIGEWVETTIYSYSLKDSAAKKLFSKIGRFSELKISKDLKYIVFNYVDSPLSSVYQGKSLLQVLDCSSDSFKINSSRDGKGVLLGNNSDDKKLYDYYVLGWQSGNTIKLKEESCAKAEAAKKNTREVLYDIEKNLMTNIDGSPAFQTEKGKQEEQQAKADSEPVKAIKSFYVYLSSGEFTKAYDLLDDRFQFNAFKLLGVNELSKKDIDVESFAIYGSLFKTAKIESIAGEKAENGIATVYLYQLFTISEGNVSKQALAAKLKKTAKGWKIISVSDGNINEKPFKQ